MATGGSITRLVQRWSGGDDEALDELVHLVYDDLRAIAHRNLRRQGDATLRPTALVHELYLRLAGAGEGTWKSRGHFFAFCSKAMRHVLIDHARRRRCGKRGGDRSRVALEGSVAALDAEIDRALAVDEALQRLERHHERMARIVECRFFGGLTVEETAEALGVSTRTVERDWTRARTYLHRLLGPDGGSAEGGRDAEPMPARRAVDPPGR